MLTAALVPILLASAEAPINVTGHAWAPFISPMGEPYRARTRDDDTLADWFHKADRDHDGALTAAEMQVDAERFFATLDSDHSGEIDPDELAHYEYEVAPDIQVTARARRAPNDPLPAARSMDSDGEPRDRESRRQRGEEDKAQLAIGGRLQGGARYSLLNIPEPVAAADTDFNRGISLAEFRQAAAARFDLLDSTHQGRLTLEALEVRRAAILASRHAKPDDKALDARVGNPLPPGN
jgi:EF hand domain-containing protein